MDTMVFTKDTRAMMRFFIVSIVHPVVSIVVKEKGGFLYDTTLRKHLILHGLFGER